MVGLESLASLTYLLIPFGFAGQLGGIKDAVSQPYFNRLASPLDFLLAPLRLLGAKQQESFPENLFRLLSNNIKYLILCGPVRENILPFSLKARHLSMTHCCICFSLFLFFFNLRDKSDLP